MTEQTPAPVSQTLRAEIKLPLKHTNISRSQGCLQRKESIACAFFALRQPQCHPRGSYIPGLDLDNAGIS